MTEDVYARAAITPFLWVAQRIFTVLITFYKVNG